MRVALVNGICAKHDAISNAVVAEYGYLQDKFGPEGVKFYGYALDYTDWNHKIVKSSAEILSDKYFLQADLVIFHFGIYYELFNVLLVGNGRAKLLACFHNVTPKEFLGADQHEIIDKSLKQQYNMLYADHVFCDSAFNKNCLVNIGLPLAKLSVMGLPVDIPETSKSKANRSKCLRILFIGRIVASKGVLDLLDALRLCVQAGRLNFELKIVGNLRFSDASYVAKVMAFLNERPELKSRVELVGEVEDTEKNYLLNDADVFVLPTYHEGFCVPIVEALASGCYVVSYENTNVPNVMGGMGSLVPTGDISSLSEVMIRLCDEWCNSDKAGVSPRFEATNSYSREEFTLQSRSWVEQFSRMAHRKKFLDLIDRLHLAT